MDVNQSQFVSVSVQAFFQGDTDPAIPCPGSASWIRLWHSCGYLEHGLPGRTGDKAARAWEVTDANRSGLHVLSTHLYPLHGGQDFLAEKEKGAVCTYSLWIESMLLISLSYKAIHIPRMLTQRLD